MNELEKLEDLLSQVSKFFDEGQWILNGSSVMVLHGINPRPMGDVDIFCSTRIWFDILDTDGWELFTTDPDDTRRRCDPPFVFKTINGYRVDIFNNWRTRNNGNIDVNLMLNSVEYVKGWPCVPLKWVLEWKSEVLRDKDHLDIEALKKAIV